VLALGEGWHATTEQRRVDPDTVLINQTQRRCVCGKKCSADRISGPTFSWAPEATYRPPTEG